MPYGLLASVFCTFLAVAVAAPIGTARQQVSHTEAGPYVNAAGSQPLGQLLVEPPQGRRACAGDGLRQQLKGLLPPHHRARAAAGAPRDALRHAAAPAEVLLSPDLAPHIRAQLPTKKHAVKGTCRTWRRGWKETLKKRERARLLVIGGSSGDAAFLNSLERYDPSTNEWEEEAVAPMPTARNYVGTAVLDGKLYAAGGQENEADLATSNPVERYDFETKAWEAVAPMAEARYDHAVAVLEGKLYAVGGCNDDDGTLFSLERYDPATNAWEAAAPMASARDSHATAVLDGRLYAVGGSGGSDNDEASLSSVERYDPATNAWEAVAPMATARLAHAMAVVDGKLYAMGGNNNGFLNSVDRYDLAVGAWEAVAPMAAARMEAFAVLMM